MRLRTKRLGVKPLHLEPEAHGHRRVAFRGMAFIVGAMKFLHLNFLPRSADFALLILRLWYGASLFWLYGWQKLTGFSAMMDKFPDPLGMGSKVSLTLAVFGEVVCTLLLVLGLFTRVAAVG